MLDLEDIFGTEGPLQRALPDFRIRRSQRHMAERVANALYNREALIVEAGTGTGKTFAYLVPALLSGRRVLISTGTRTLQDQLFSKDLPLVSAALGRPARVALLKGRSNYLCRYHLNHAAASIEGSYESTIDDREEGDMLARIVRWSRTTRAGDLAEVRGLSDTNPVWGQVTSTRDNCLGNRCPEFSRCHVALARREAQEADVVIVNHHLLLADLALKEDGFGDILGSADAVILDEAHQIPDLAAQFFGASVSSRRVDNVVKAAQLELNSTVLAALSGRAQAVEAAHAVEVALANLAERIPARLGRLSWGDTQAPLDNVVQALADALEKLGTHLEAFDTYAPVAQIGTRALELASSLERIAGMDEADGTRAIETSARSFVLSLMPFDVSTRFLALITSRPCAWIFASATLSLGDDFSHFTGRLGLGDTATLKIESPFNYEIQSVLYLPQGMPEPSSPGYVAAVIKTARPLIEASEGGAFVLFTSHRALAQGAALLRSAWGDTPPYKICVQGEAPRERLLKEFREDGNAVLLGTTSFWEGVDVKGGALRLVVIEKLPFASPDDPLVKARIEYLQTTGGNAFRDYQLPEAALALKQGVGRLIRSEEDYGTVVICDPRIVGKGYGRTFLKALPAMRATRDVDEATRFIRRHAPVKVVAPRLAQQA